MGRVYCLSRLRNSNIDDNNRFSEAIGELCEEAKLIANVRITGNRMNRIEDSAQINIAIFARSTRSQRKSDFAVGTIAIRTPVSPRSIPRHRKQRELNRLLLTRRSDCQHLLAVDVTNDAIRIQPNA